jgi:hypothetical protein
MWLPVARSKTSQGVQGAILLNGNLGGLLPLYLLTVQSFNVFNVLCIRSSSAAVPSWQQAVVSIAIIRQFESKRLGLK